VFINDFSYGVAERFGYLVWRDRKIMDRADLKPLRFSFVPRTLATVPIEERNPQDSLVIGEIV